ncbi:type II secretion system protein E [Pseudomonas sp. MF6396]|uniref:GspE/PulE family protein n=1 Tax=Pseudomonas sp. MF6396 TaxID=1960828 RepID=UPI0009972611|nr:GspE/PulE family protein [Pseudomonas sp. MF6396]OOW02023.1 type II secretion system protein E [Pseudomonas sp. MF6396]
MPATPPDRWLDLDTLLAELLAQQRIRPACAHPWPQAANEPTHPLERIARRGLNDLQRPGHTLDLDALGEWLGRQAGQRHVRIDPLALQAASLGGLMSAAFARRHQILAIAVDAHTVTVASAQPYVRSWERDLGQVLQRRVQRVLASPVQIRELSQAVFRLAHSVSGASQQAVPGPEGASLEALLDLGNSAGDVDANETHIVGIVDWLLQYAFEQRASDIHIEPRRDQGHLRLRIDGLLHPAYQFPPAVTLAVVSRLKSLGRMNVAEKRRPQDGRIKARSAAGAEVELRLATLPTAFGEKLVLRIFDPHLLHQDFTQLGLDGKALQHWQAMLRQPHGIILVTGPTGSGKTSTLYATLKQLATPQVNLCTLEDPIEQLEPAFNQMQVQPGIDLGFANGVRALLRQDPDIIMIGEIRDADTAQVAIQAALTGHLVLSTLHTNDACGAVGRLLELGIAPYLIRATLVGVLAQRLVRTLCPACKVAQPLDMAHWRELDPQAPLPTATCQAEGCRDCRYTGYRGRTGLFELLPVSPRLREQLSGDVDLANLRRQARAEGLGSLRTSGAQKVAAGLTTLTEVIRVTA